MNPEGNPRLMEYLAREGLLWPASRIEAATAGETEQIAENANCSGSTEGESLTREAGDAQ
jgi:hypothetical protein